MKSSNKLNTNTPWWKKLWSYLRPIKIQTITKESGDAIAVYLASNQFQLTYNQAIYSNGLDYIPFLRAFEAIESGLGAIQKVLVLGAGLGSIPQILVQKYRLQNLHFTIVDIDNTILDLCQQHLKYQGVVNCEFIHSNALTFLEETQRKYDLICVDIFDDIYVPDSFQTASFLKLTGNCLSGSSGLFVYNFIPYKNGDFETLKKNFEHTFTATQIVYYNRNTLFIGKQFKFTP